jgi:hypothetical protein
VRDGRPRDGRRLVIWQFPGFARWHRDSGRYDVGLGSTYVYERMTSEQQGAIALTWWPADVRMHRGHGGGRHTCNTAPFAIGSAAGCAPHRDPAARWRLAL